MASSEKSTDEQKILTPTFAYFSAANKQKNQPSLILPARYRAPQAKSKKSKAETKLEFFGFEDKEEQEGDERPESGMVGKSSYKIKYFGFDDLSESDSDDESSQAREKKAKKAAAALAALSSGVDSPHTSDSQDSQASSNTGEILLLMYSTCLFIGFSHHQVEMELERSLHTGCKFARRIIRLFFFLKPLQVNGTFHTDTHYFSFGAKEREPNFIR